LLGLGAGQAMWKIQIIDINATDNPLALYSVKENRKIPFRVESFGWNLLGLVLDHVPRTDSLWVDVPEGHALEALCEQLWILFPEYGDGSIELRVCE
jgi:hypothetical protein